MFFQFLGIFSSFEAEFLAVCIAADKVAQLNLPRIWIECDSSLVVNCLRQRSLWVPLCVRGLWYICLEKLALLSIRVTNVCREGNKVADRLAGMGCYLDTQSWWHGIPACVIDFLVNGAISVVNYKVRMLALYFFIFCFIL